MSANLTLEQLRRIFRLVGECTELGADPILWREHLAQSIPSLIQDCFVNVVDSPFPTRQGEAKPMIPLSYSSGGALPSGNYALLHQFMQRAGELSPIVPSMLANPSPMQISARAEMVPDRDWFHSDYYQHYVRPMGLAEQLTSIDARTTQSVSSICILSIAGEIFSDRQRLILEVIHQEVTRQRMAGKLAPLGGFSLTSLTPRQIQVLIGIMQGDSEKQLARKLCISPHTVHDHLKKLHMRFGVSSRGELCSRLLRLWPALEYIAGEL